MYGDTVSSGNSGQREAIRALSRAPSNSTCTMSSRSSTDSKENEPPALSLPKRQQASSRFTHPHKPKVVSDTQSLPAGLAMLRERAEREETYEGDATGTQQSTWEIPPVPGFSDLISGTYEDGTPVFSNKPRPSRFSSSRFQRSTSQQADSRLSYRSDVEAVNVPESEQAIVLSIKVLQDKNAQLENARTEREIYILELEQRNQELESDNAFLQRRSRSDSAVGLNDEDSDDTQGSGMAERTLTIQKNRLEHDLRAVTRQVEEANKKVSISETTMKGVIKERDQAVHQLGLAYVQQEKLKYANNRLAQSNQNLAADVEYAHQQVVRLKELTMREAQKASPVGRDVNEYLFGKKAADAISSQASAEAQIATTTTRQEPVSPLETKEGRGRDVKGSLRTDQSLLGGQSPNNSASTINSPDFNEDTGIIRMPHRSFPRENDEGNTYSTNVTMPKESEVADLRSKLEHKRVTKEHTPLRRRSASDTVAEIAEASLRKCAERRKRMETSSKSLEATAASSRGLTSRTETPTENIRANGAATRHRRSVSDPSSERPKVEKVKRMEKAESEEEFDSGQLFYDLAMEMKEADELAERSKSSTSSKSSKSDDTLTKPILKVPNKAKPAAVSVRKRVSFDEEDRTKRPSQAPDEILAEHIEAFHKELGVLNDKRDAAQRDYDNLDPALGRRHHMAARKSLDILAAEVDWKRKQIYGTYDILEDRRQAGLFNEDDFDRGCRLR